MKKLLTLAAAVGLAGGMALVAAPSAHAVCNDGPNAGRTVVAVNPADGGDVYTFGNNVGLEGPHGYIEAGDAGVQGNSTDAPLEGKATAAPSACINGMVII